MCQVSQVAQEFSTLAWSDANLHYGNFLFRLTGLYAKLNGLTGLVWRLHVQQLLKGAEFETMASYGCG
eukprot:6252139-Amphidinium_carterae.1